MSLSCKHLQGLTVATFPSPKTPAPAPGRRSPKLRRIRSLWSQAIL
jgi:hypothetical protein